MESGKLSTKMKWTDQEMETLEKQVEVVPVDVGDLQILAEDWRINQFGAFGCRHLVYVESGTGNWKLTYSLSSAICRRGL